MVDKAKDGFLGKTFNKVKNNIRQIARNKEVERIIEENLEKVVQKERIDEADDMMRLARKVSPPSDGDWTSTHSKFKELYKFPCLHMLLNDSKSIGIRGLLHQESKRDNFPSFDRDAKKELQDLMEKMEIESGNEYWENLIWMKLEEIRRKIGESK